MSLEDESSLSEINILSDGRICLFGASQQVLEVLDAIPLDDHALKSRIEQLRAVGERPAGEAHVACFVENQTQKNRGRSHRHE